MKLPDLFHESENAKLDFIDPTKKSRLKSHRVLKCPHID
jgi:hypothetical protein